MSAPWDEWDHVVKLDPDKDLYEDETFEEICASGTDAIEIGGTLGVTKEKVRPMVEACIEHDVPVYQEPSSPDVVLEDPKPTGYLVPTVFNAGDVFWVTGAHKEWVRIADRMDWERTDTEAYIVMNPEASVAEYTQADCSLDAGEVAAYATTADRMFGQDIVYVEYSGTLGDPEKVGAAHDAVHDATVFYGGGVHDYESAKLMGDNADVVVVGDLVHDEGIEALRETVRGANDGSA